MTQGCWFGLAGAGLCWIATGLLCRVARRARWLDLPDARRLHAQPTPRLGGVGFVLALGPALAFHPRPGVAVAIGSYFLVGFADDLRRRRGGVFAGPKLLLQAVAAALAVGLGGLRLSGAASTPWPAWPATLTSPIATALWLLVVVNLVNFMDGIDTWAAVVGAVLLGAWAGAAGAHGGAIWAWAGLGGLAGFSLWNAPPARCFLGDGGSHALGALLACAPCVDAGAGAAPALPLVVACAGLSRYAADVGEALVRKVARGVPLARAHEDHLYQRLVKAGQPPLVVATHYGLAVLGIAVGWGPVAASFGPVVGAGIGSALLLAHVGYAAHATRHVPRTLVP